MAANGVRCRASDRRDSDRRDSDRRAYQTRTCVREVLI